MRVSSSQLNQIVQQGLRRQDLAYAEVMTQMSSGYRINRSSDDPLGTISLIGLEREQSSLSQYRDNASRVISRLERAESHLDASVNVVLRIQDLTLQAVNGSATDSDREALAGELSTLNQTLLSFANARDEDGSYIFSGSRLDTPPVADTGAGLAYQGDDRLREVPVAQGVTVATNVTLESVYFNGESNGESFFADLEGFIADLKTGSATLATTGPDLIDSLGRTVNGLGTKLTEIGAQIVSARSLSTAQEDLSLANEKIRGRIQDLDYVEAAGRVNEIEMALSATQQTYSKLSQLSLFNYMK